MKKIMLILASLWLSGCSYHMADLSIVSNKNVNLEKVNLDRLPQIKNVTGKDTAYSIYFIPLGEAHIQDAISDALNKADGDLMIDVSVYKRVFWFIVGMNQYEVKGTVIKTRGVK